MTIDDLRTRLARGPLVLDGAMSTFLHASAGGTGPASATDALTRSHPDAVRRVHDAYLDAGADIVRTNTFRAASSAHERDARGLCRAAAELARTAASDWSRRTPDRPRLVAGALGPADTPGGAQPSAAETNHLRRRFHDALAGLLEGGVDLLFFETWWCPAQIGAAQRAFAEAAASTGRGVPVFVSMPVSRDGRVAASGSRLDETLDSIDPQWADGVGINCGTAPEGLEAALAACRRRWPLVTCYPSAGLPDAPADPEPFARHVAAYAASGLAGLVGGCCGTTPAHIRALALAVATSRHAGRQ